MSNIITGLREKSFKYIHCVPDGNGQMPSHSICFKTVCRTKKILFSLVRTIVSAVHQHTRPAICKTYLLNASSLQTTNIPCAQLINHLIRGNSELEEILIVLRNSIHRHASQFRIEVYTFKCFNFANQNQNYYLFAMTDDGFFSLFFRRVIFIPKFRVSIFGQLQYLSADETDNQ